jgi:mannose-6-phosphate isomerase-like protein (cupin superfamily)
VKLLTARQLGASVAKKQGGLVSANLPTGDGGPTILMVRGDGPAEVELHQAVNDVFVVHAGAAAALVGALATGDVLFIPAGVPDQVVAPLGGAFSYVALKFPAERGTR